MKKALIISGGWIGHDPEGVADVFEKILRGEGFEVDRATDLAVYESDLSGYDLLVPNWTMGELSGDAIANINRAVASGVGLAGCHAGLCDAFRQSDLWQFITGAQFVAHPGGGQTTYTVCMRPDCPDPLTDGIGDFEVTSEQYYLHVDPAVRVLATTRAPMADGPFAPNGEVLMPVVYTKRWGEGRVFYCSLGHNREFFEKYPQACELMRRGFLYAAR
ncbi:MAG: ThuA domain-containing protein [Clostridia bacterium]|nr:ThuA domain-containing protein [Clostridia bacterium]